MTNGMLSGFIFSLPIYSFNAGFYYNIFIIIMAGLFNYFSCYLYIWHLGGQLDVDRMIEFHFRKDHHIQKIKNMYGIVVFFNLLFIVIFYFDMMCQQVYRTIYLFIGNPKGFISIGVFLGVTLGTLFILLILAMIIKKFHYGVNILSFGILTVIVYCFVLILL